MSTRDELSFDLTCTVRDTCLCHHVQRAARAIARHFDEAFRPLDLTNGQFSLMMSLNAPVAPTIGTISNLLAMDRTTLTANLKPLERRGLVSVAVDEGDRRGRVLTLTASGRQLLAAALPAWKRTHAAIEGLLAAPDRLRVDLRALS